MEKDKGFFIIINPHSAQGKVMKWWKRIQPQIEAQGIQYQVAFTTAADSGSLQVGQALAEGYKKIVAVGGDGTVNEMVNGFFRDDELISNDAVFGFWPAGTGNDLARVIYEDTSDQAFLAFLTNPQIKHIDIGKVAFSDFVGQKTVRYFLSDFTIGLGADTCYIVNNNSKHLGGRISFFTAAVKAIIAFQLKPITVVIDGQETVRDSFILVSCNNGKYFGGGMMIAPDALPDDGKLDLIMAAGLKKGEILNLLMKVYKGKHLNNKNVVYKKITGLHIESDYPLLLEVDGETPGNIPVDLQVMPSKLPLMVPAGKA